MKTPDRRITVIAYTLLTIWLLTYAYACLATSNVAAQFPDAVSRLAGATKTLAAVSGDTSQVEAADVRRVTALFSSFAVLEEQNAGSEKRFRMPSVE